MLTGPPPKFHGTRDILGAVAKGFCDKGRRAFEDEFADGTVSGTEQVDT